jgi:hypothetical protein
MGRTHSAGGAGSSAGSNAALGEQLAAIIERLPSGAITLQELLDTFSDEGLLLLTILLTLIFMIPVSIPGVSTVFGAAILLVGISRLIGRPLWLPAKLRPRALPADKLRPGLSAGLVWVHRLEKISRPHRLRLLVDGRAVGVLNNLAFILAALLLMLPFSLVPFSNTLPALALLLYAIGFIQRDGIAVVLGHTANIGTLAYFGVLLSGGGLAALEVLQWFQR